jgi:hypothetical protein
VLACHFHFLKDIGKDLLDAPHGELRALFRRSEIRPRLRGLARDLGVKLGSGIEEGREEVKAWQDLKEAGHSIPPSRAGLATIRALAQWILDFQVQSRGQSFPFARPYLDLYDRCVKGRRAIDAFLCGNLEDKTISKALDRLQRILDPVACDIPFSPVVKRLRTRADLFDELRDALRLAPESEDHESSPEKEAATLSDIRKQVENLTQSLEARRPKRGPAKDTRKAIDTLLTHIRHHGKPVGPRDPPARRDRWRHATRGQNQQQPRAFFRHDEARRASPQWPQEPGQGARGPAGWSPAGI